MGELVTDKSKCNKMSVVESVLNRCLVQFFHISCSLKILVMKCWMGGGHVEKFKMPLVYGFL